LSQRTSSWSWTARAEHEEWSPIHAIHKAPLGEAWGSSQRMFVVDATSFDEGAQSVADRFKRRQPVILNLQRADEDLSKRMVDFCAGLAYALDGEMHPIVDRLFLLTPSEVEVSSNERPREARNAFFNQF
jgi:cell division inhibitor SepF